MIMSLLARARRQSASNPDEGSALIIVIIGCMALVALSLVLAQATINAVRPSDQSEKSFAARAAAEAGIDDYRARLLVDNRYFLRAPDATNPALTGWADVPGGAGQGQFTYSIDTSRALVAGELRISSTGKVDGVTRTVEAVLTKRSTLDYVYISDIESMAPSLPGAYSDPAVAAELCTNRRWAAAGQVSKTGTTPLNGIHRNSNYCRWAGIYNTERIKGRIHTNDVWYLSSAIPNIDPLSTGGNSTAVFDGAITTSCPPVVTGAAGCPEGMRWINTSDVSSNTSGAWGSGTTYKAAELSGTQTGKLWNPTYDTVLEIPASNSRMRELAMDKGCVFTGPTRIRFRPDGTMAVTSPATRATTAMCGGTALYANPATPAVQPTVTLDLGAMKSAGFNGVVYVQGTLSPPVGDANRWVAGTSAACLKKTVTSVNSYPFVIPAAAEQTELFNSSYTGKKGFPSEKFGSDPGWYDCDAGDVFVQGEFTGAVTIATEHDIALTGPVIDSNDTNKSNTAAADYGVPPLTSNNMLGLVPYRFLYAYRPLDSNTSSAAETPDWNWQKNKNVIYNFAAVVLTQCFGSQDATRGSNMGGIYLRGSLGQKYRCPVGVSGGGSAYQKFYQYDQRYMVEDPPPYMLELSNEPWKVKAYSETGIRRDPVALAGITADTGTQARSTTRTYNVLANDVSGNKLTGAVIKAGVGTVSVVGNQISFIAPSTVGQTVIEYIVTKPDGSRAAQTLTITIT